MKLHSIDLPCLYLVLTMFLFVVKWIIIQKFLQFNKRSIYILCVLYFYAMKLHSIDLPCLYLVLTMFLFVVKWIIIQKFLQFNKRSIYILCVLYFYAMPLKVSTLQMP